MLPEWNTSDAKNGSRNGAIMTFRESISTCFSKFADGQGRATRSEFWYFYLFYVVVWLAVKVIEGPILYTANIGIFFLMLPIALSIALFVLMIPNIAAAVRRMHDVDKSGWFVLIPIYNLVLLATPGTVGPNRFGPNPGDAENWAQTTTAHPGQDFSYLQNPESDLTHTHAPEQMYVYSPPKKRKTLAWVGFSLVIVSPLVAFSPFILAGIGAQLFCEGGLAGANEGNCGWAALPWFMLVSIPTAGLLAIVGLVLGLIGLTQKR
jgi:uncharacterized membrane protein YhaH (DUF805 family)